LILIDGGDVELSVPVADMRGREVEDDVFTSVDPAWYRTGIRARLLLGRTSGLPPGKFFFFLFQFLF
jgi:hypothetical protein